MSLPGHLMRYKLAIFDFDGTLADSFPWFCRAVSQAADRFRFRTVSADEVAELRSLEAAHIVQRLDVPTWKMPFIARYMRRHMARELDGIRLFPGIEEALRRVVDSGVTLAIVTSNDPRNVRRVLGRELASLIAHYGCGASLFGKRLKLRAVLRASRRQPGEAIYLGDELRDLHAARAERIDFGAVSWGYTLPHAFNAHGARILESPSEISALLCRPR